jgi:DNA-entry nuclease
MKEKVKNDSNINIKQILTLIFFIIIIVICIFVTNNYNENDNKVNVQPTFSYTLDAIPEYSSQPYVTINSNIPNFQENDFTNNSFEDYSDMDDYGRCGVAFAN